MPVELAPIALFVYNRPQHTARLLQSLLANPLAAQSRLYVFADGPKANASATELQRVADTRKLFDCLTGFAKVELRSAPENRGLAASVVEGVSLVLQRHGRIVVLEDDLELAPHFLHFMNEGLELYANRPDVYSVNGFMFPLKHKPAAGSVLLPYTSTWGWGTWQSKWAVFDAAMPGKEQLLQNPRRVEQFNISGYRYTDMLHLGNNSWGIRWYYSVFMKQGLNLFPTRSLVNNTGFDGSGTNCEEVPSEPVPLYQGFIQPALHATSDPEFHRQYIEYFRKLTQPTLVEKLMQRIKHSFR